ncbi:ABC transporter ATP-binding protein [Methanosarcina sp.]|uniref:ABC transporter ATP-binding protein n=1 Tax=Methanosarcina sp. TaxID=2213 RepID=UPI002988AC4A|nr:ABC transporter ATP-binding protein [Methanosarcina sp.]MDW5551918.1 ABC transporter ATP-binding protein [Methanosarcina sp.]MDW5554563.1 ABC transporter ATP-binding protein [Methanosarcina sp.]MDW5561226.1 ABC transporter ATP-binding protein [Methanosarcina sp.]
MEPIIEVKNLVKTFDSRGKKITAVNDVSFTVFKGEIFGMIGPNGAGKSTTFSMLTTLTKPTSGNIKVSGLDVGKQDDRIRPIIGIVPQKLSLYPLLTARENLKFMGKLYNIPKKVMEERIDYYLRLVGLEDSADRFTEGFSGGMKQRLSVICAVMHDPQILFWDEPSTGLDPQTRQAIWKLARKFNEDGKTLIFTTHYMEEAENICDRVAVMNLGKMVALDNPEVLKETSGSLNLEQVFMHFTGEGMCN